MFSSNLLRRILVVELSICFSRHEVLDSLPMYDTLVAPLLLRRSWAVVVAQKRTCSALGSRNCWLFGNQNMIKHAETSLLPCSEQLVANSSLNFDYSIWVETRSLAGSGPIPVETFLTQVVIKSLIRACMSCLFIHMIIC